jgi:hypothetical protein
MLLWRSCFAAWKRLSEAERAAYPVVAYDESAEQALIGLPHR